MDPEQVKRDADGAMRCTICGFAYSLSAGEVVQASAEGLEDVRNALAGVPTPLRSQRPQPAVWSVNAYVAHLADASAVILDRVVAISTRDRPHLAYHDQDAAVTDSGADDLAADESLARLHRTVSVFQEKIGGLSTAAWERIGLHQRAGEVRLAEIAQDMPHELLHHAMDIRQVGNQVAET